MGEGNLELIDFGLMMRINYIRYGSVLEPNPLDKDREIKDLSIDQMRLIIKMETLRKELRKGELVLRRKKR